MIARTDCLRGGLLLALSLSVGAGCGGAPPVLDSKVVRAPRIAMRDAKVVALDLQEGTCVDVRNAAGSPEAADAQVSCAGTPFATDMVNQVRARVKARLKEAGLTLADETTPPDATLQGSVAITRERNVTAPADETNEALCNAACGQPTCVRFEFAARLSVTAALSGPAGPDGAPQTADGTYTGNGLAVPESAMATVHVCAPADGATVLQDEAHVNWTRASGEALDEMDEMSARFFKSWREAWEPVLLTDVEVLSDGRSGLQAGHEGRWADAEEAFREALASEDAGPLRGHLLHNVAGVVLAQKRLDDAKAAITEGLSLTQDDDMTRMAAEVDRRLADRAKLSSEAVAAPAVESETAVASTLPVEEAPPAEAAVEAPAVEAAAVEAPVEAAAVEAPVEAAAVEAPVEAAAVEAPVEKPAPAGGGQSGGPCFVMGSKVVKFRIDASHKATPTGLVQPGAEMRCYETKAGWRRVELVDGSVAGYLPEYLVGRR